MNTFVGLAAICIGIYSAWMGLERAHESDDPRLVLIYSAIVILAVLLTFLGALILTGGVLWF